MSRPDPLRPFFDVRIWLQKAAGDFRWHQEEWVSKGQPRQVVEKRLTLLDRSVLHELAGYMDQPGVNGRPKASTIAGILGQETKSIERALHRLANAGLLEATIEKPHIGRAQVWQFTDAFRAVLHSTAEAHREEAHRGEGLSRKRPSGEHQEAHRGETRGPPRGVPTDMTDRNRSVEYSTNPSPSRNDPARCGHRAVDDEGWCAGCSTQIEEAAS